MKSNLKQMISIPILNIAIEKKGYEMSYPLQLDIKDDSRKTKGNDIFCRFVLHPQVPSCGIAENPMASIPYDQGRIALRCVSYHGIVV